MLRTGQTTSREQVDVEAYEVWRACKDVERLLFLFKSSRQRPPAELERLETWVRKIAAANEVSLNCH